MAGDGSPKAEEFQPHPVKDQLPGVDFCVSSSPPWPEAILLGFQHYVVMLGTTVIIASILTPLMGGEKGDKADLINTLLFVAGINTLLQTLFGTRLPIVMGGSYAFIVPSISIALSSRYDVYLDPHERFQHCMRAMQGALIIASFFTMIIGFFGFWRIFARYLTPLSAVPLVVLTGLGLYSHGFSQLVACVEVGLPALVILVALSQYLPHVMEYKRSIYERFAVLLSIAIIWVYAEILSVAGAYNNRTPEIQNSCRADRSGLIGAAPWIRLPYPFQWGRPSFHAGDVFAITASSFVAIIESTGTFIAASRYASATPIPASVLSRGIGWQGIGLLLCGFFGTGNGCTASVENAGLLGLTRVGSRRVTQIAAGFMLFFSILGKFGAVLASIPWSIMAAVYCVLFGYVASAGLGFLQFCNMNNFRSMFILGFGLFMGLSVSQYFNESIVKLGHGPVHTPTHAFNDMMQVIFASPATVAVIVAYVLDLTHSLGDSSVRRDNGWHWWAKFKYFDADTRSGEFYGLPGNLNRFFPSF